MTSDEKRTLRVVLGSVVVAVAALGSIALLALRSSPQTAEAERELELEPSAAATASAELPTRVPAPSRPSESPAQAERGEPMAAHATSAPPEAAPDAGEIPPEAREHGRAMLLHTLLAVVDKQDVEQARWLRKQLDDGRARGVIPQADIEAVDLVIDCLAHAPDAREEARDFLQFAPPPTLAPAVRRACE